MQERVKRRHAVTEMGGGTTTLLFVHGLGASQRVWSRLAPAFTDRYRVVLMDLMGCGASDPAGYDPQRYATLKGHADDLVEVAENLRQGRIVLVVHSIGAMLGLLAELDAPHLFDAHVMVSPSPCYLNLPDYPGGLEPADVQAMLAQIDADPHAWAHTMAPTFMGEPIEHEATALLNADLMRALPQALRQFAHATFRCDFRSQLPQLVKPVLLLQSAEDPIAPVAVGRYMERQLPDGRLEVIPMRGHFPQLLRPQDCARAIDAFLAGSGFRPSAGMLAARAQGTSR